MRTISVAGMILLIAMLACEKNSNKENTPQENQDQAFITNYFPLYPGSYWVYNSYRIDSIGTRELISENDTVEIIGDTTINHEPYAIFYRKPILFLDREKEQFYYRDSANFIINDKGEIILALNTFEDTLAIEYNTNPPTDSSIYWYSKMAEYNTVLSLPGGNFDSLTNNLLTVVYNSPDNLTRQLNRLYAKNVGNVFRQNIYIHRYRENGEYYETELVDHFINRPIQIQE